MDQRNLSSNNKVAPAFNPARSGPCILEKTARARVTAKSLFGAPIQWRRAVALKALAARGERFAPERSSYLPGTFAAEDMMCAAADSKHPDAFVMLSAAHPEDSGRVSILVSVTDQVRQAGCDQPGVPLNFRMLAPGG